MVSNSNSAVFAGINHMYTPIYFLVTHMYTPIYFLDLELRWICMKRDDFVCKYFLVNVSISYNSCSEMPSGRSARFLQLADLLCVTVALLLLWLNQQELLHSASCWGTDCHTGLVHRAVAKISERKQGLHVGLKGQTWWSFIFSTGYWEAEWRWTVLLFACCS